LKVPDPGEARTGPTTTQGFFSMADENGRLTDLWGNPWTPEPDPRGRKRHKRCAQVAENVSVLKAAGLTVEQIAARVNLSEPTLRKYYFRELDAGAVLAEAVLTEAMWKKAREGNVSAARFIRETFSKGEVADADRRVRGREEPREEPVGKKEERLRAARGVTGRFATPSGPRLAVDNG
jgi:DNA-binding transcriptional ArsR family regulator